MSVYYVLAAEVMMVKIGFAEHPHSRLTKMRADSPVELKIAAVEDGCRILEAARHKQFAHLWRRGEWFSYQGELRSFIEQLPHPNAVLEAINDVDPVIDQVRDVADLFTGDHRKTIDSLGGIRGLARRLGHKHHTTVQGWWERGNIPADRLNEVLAAAALPARARETGSAAA